jgi:outer membrane lipoprotein SlyB
MKSQAMISAAAVMAVLLTGCVNPNGSPNNTGSGALMGGAMGALTGAAIGGRGHAGPDALIGMAVGAVAGGLIGNSADREQEARIQAQAPRTYIPANPGQPTSIADVNAMAKASISDDVIISQITSSRTVYHLIAADVIGLRDAGVSDRVLNFMINTPSLWAR